MFRYVFGKDKPRDEIDNPIIDEIVGGVLMSSMIKPYPTTTNLAYLHKNIGNWYKAAKDRVEHISIRSSYVWKNNRWRQK